jgi:polar amino acid transport system substrate-binding protein
MHKATVAVLAACLTLIVIGCGSSPAPSEEPETGIEVPLGADLRLGSDPWPPFTDRAPRPRVAIELVHTALDRCGVQAATIIQDDFGAITRQIEAGELDGSAAIWRSKEREAYLLFSRPYFENRLVLVGGKDSNVAGVGLFGLTGVRIGIVAGYDYGPAVRTARGPTFEEGPSDLANLKALADGKLDYVLADELLAYHLVQQEEKARRLLRIGDKAIVRLPLHFAVRKSHPHAATIIERFDRTVRQMMADGSFNRLLQLDAIEVDLDGDGRREVVFASGRVGVKPPTRTYPLFLGDSAGASDTRYHVDGRTYESWDDIPSRYRTEGARREEGVQLFELNF